MAGAWPLPVSAIEIPFSDEKIDVADDYYDDE